MLKINLEYLLTIVSKDYNSYKSIACVIIFKRYIKRTGEFSNYFSARFEYNGDNFPLDIHL